MQQELGLSNCVTGPRSFYYLLCPPREKVVVRRAQIGRRVISARPRTQVKAKLKSSSQRQAVQKEVIVKKDTQSSFREQQRLEIQTQIDELQE